MPSKVRKVPHRADEAAEGHGEEFALPDVVDHETRLGATLADAHFVLKPGIALLDMNTR